MTTPSGYFAWPQGINVQNPIFGAAGDGVTDDWAAIQGAIDVAEGSNGTVILPAGTYLISKSLTVKGNMALVGEGPWQTTLQLADNANCDMITTPNDKQYYGLVIRDLGFDGNAANQSSGSAIHLLGMNNATLDNLFIQHPKNHGIHYGGPTQKAGLFTEVPMSTNLELWADETNTTGHGIYFDTGSSDSITVGNDIGFFKQGSGVAYSDHQGAVITSCNAWQNQNGYLIYGTSRLRMDNCLSDLAQEYGFVLQSGTDLPVQNIQISNCQARESGQAAAATYDGLFFQGASSSYPVENVTVSGFQAFASQAGGISIDEYATKIRILGGDVSGSSGTIALGTTGISDIEIANVEGYNPVGKLTAPAIPTSGTAVTNGFGVTARVFVSGGTVSAIALNGTDTGLTSGQITLAPSETISLTYSAAPGWAWFGL